MSGRRILVIVLLALSLSACGSADRDNLMDGAPPAGSAGAEAVLVLADGVRDGEKLLAWAASLEHHLGGAVEVGFSGLTAADENAGRQSPLSAALALSALKPEHVTVFYAVAHAGRRSTALRNDAAVAAALQVLDAPVSVVEGFGCRGFMQTYLKQRVQRLCAGKSIKLSESVLIVPLVEPFTAPATTVQLRQTFRDVRFVTSDRLLWQSLAIHAGRGGRKLVVPYLAAPQDLASFRLKTCALLPGVLVDQACILDEALSLDIVSVGR